MKLLKMTISNYHLADVIHYIIYIIIHYLLRLKNLHIYIFFLNYINLSLYPQWFSKLYLPNKMTEHILNIKVVNSLSNFEPKV